MLLDTSGLLCLYDDSDHRHQDAETYFDAAPILLMHNYILAELVPLSQTRGYIRSDVLAFLAEVTVNEDVEIV